MAKTKKNPKKQTTKIMILTSKNHEPKCNNKNSSIIGSRNDIQPWTIVAILSDRVNEGTMCAGMKEIGERRERKTCKKMRKWKEQREEGEEERKNEWRKKMKKENKKMSGEELGCRRREVVCI